MTPKFLFSVYNISGYFIAELEELSKSAEIVVLETPCDCIDKGVLRDTVRWINRQRIASVDDLIQMLGDFIPDVFFCGGWMDKLCLEYARKFHQMGGKTVLTLDTPWRGDARQWMHCLFSRLYLTRIFDWAWCAGAPQRRYLRMLGFSAASIQTGVYCANTSKFAPIGKRKLENPKSWPHVFLYIGRYVSVKNMRRMERAFIKAVEVAGGDWILRCIGGGPLWDERTVHPRIEHMGYKRPSEIAEYIQDAGCFVLPSLCEPWGVVVHEAALMGLPMICSNRVQATTAYLRENVNGRLFDPEDEESIMNAFVEMMRQGDAELFAMGNKSHSLGLSYTTNKWAERALAFVK